MSDTHQLVAVVTGAGGGIGKATAGLLAERGYLVVAADMNRDAVEPVAADIGGRAVTLDVSDRDAVSALASDLADRYGRVDAVVNSAGIWRHIPLAEVPYEIARQVLEVNVLGSWSMVQTLAPLMSAGAAIVNLSSSSTTIAPSGLGLYIRTDGTERGYQTGARQALGATLPLGRHGEAIDIAKVVAFLLGEESAYMTGQTVIVDGGLTLIGIPPTAAVATGGQLPG
jgi:3-oxoacyl-[acyl-carrier protein] reductase